MTTLAPVAIARLALGAGLNGGAAGMAVAVALAESGGVTDAVSSTGDYGLWQINAKAHPQYDTARLLADPAYNAKAMAEVSGGGMNWKPWAVYWSTPFTGGPGEGPYKRHVQTAGQAVKEAGGDLPDAGNPADISPQAIDAVLPLDGVTDPLIALGKLVNKLLDAALWRRLGIGALGVALLILAAVILSRDLIASTATAVAGAK